MVLLFICIIRHKMLNGQIGEEGIRMNVVQHNLAKFEVIS